VSPYLRKHKKKTTGDLWYRMPVWCSDDTMDAANNPQPTSTGVKLPVIWPIAHQSGDHLHGFLVQIEISVM
jgi:hypothetical protein